MKNHQFAYKSWVGRSHFERHRVFAHQWRVARCRVWRYFAGLIYVGGGWRTRDERLSCAGALPLLRGREGLCLRVLPVAKVLGGSELGQLGLQDSDWDASDSDAERWGGAEGCGDGELIGVGARGPGGCGVLAGRLGDWKRWLTRLHVADWYTVFYTIRVDVGACGSKEVEIERWPTQ